MLTFDFFRFYDIEANICDEDARWPSEMNSEWSVQSCCISLVALAMGIFKNLPVVCQVKSEKQGEAIMSMTGQ